MLSRIWNWKRIRVGGSSVSLMFVLLLIFVVTAVAWSAWFAFSASVTTNVVFQDPPTEIDVVITGNCSHSGGAGQSNGNAVVTGHDIECNFSAINETSSFNVAVTVNNATSGVPVELAFGALDPTPCFDISADAPITIIAGASGYIQTYYVGNSQTYTCAGGPGAFVSSYSVTPQ